MIDIKFTTFKNKDYAYLRDTTFLVQIGKFPQGLYSTHYKTIGDMTEAIEVYNKLEVMPKHRKRIVMVGNIGQTVVDVEKF